VTLGTTSGVNTTAVTAVVAGLIGSPVTFTASATAGPVSQLAPVSGNSQTDTVGQAVPESLVVVVRDQFANPVSGTIVEWVSWRGWKRVHYGRGNGWPGTRGRCLDARPVVGAQRVTALSGSHGPPAEFVATR
jgi:hypothetical protein